MSDWVIRDATTADGAACRAIYAPYVTETAITFENEVPSVDEMAARIAKSLARHAWLVMDVDGEPVGYAYAGEYRARPAYGWACEASVYLRTGRRRTGAGRALYEALLPRLAARGYRRIMAGITVPNDASLGLHHAFGFTDVGLARKVGWKLGGWHDVATLELDLTPDEDPVVAPEPIH